MNGMNFPPGRPYCPHYRGGLGPASSQRLRGRFPDTVGLLINTPALPADRAAYFVGLANRPDLQAKVEM